MQVGFAGDADGFANEPGRFDGNGDVRGLDRGGGRDGADEKDLAFVGVDLDVAGFDKAFGEGPADGAGGETFGDLRIEGGGESGVAGILPIGVPSGSHAEEETEAEGLSGDNGGGVGEEGGFDQSLALMELGGGRGREEKSKKKKRREKNE